MDSSFYVYYCLNKKGIYVQIKQVTSSWNRKFLDAPGRTGKIFIINLILAAVRSQNDIALCLASSGIAAILLPGGRTAHYALKV
ncbi:hypothetical protein TNIN_272661 [Trichonephila inaurata madagascariensis]|uniref:ATP-dependent DNA helicase n=1 Tax=Trichonephila inaurata madagascariensis TaxID=2747483 RepID=A0A8X6MFK8_9ARAC|nr:hypothetical protein TNIN_272661 [Trichonephila inaurata madagascariensis]